VEGCGYKESLKSAFKKGQKVMSDIPKQRLIRPKDAAVYLCISERKLFSMTKEETIPAIKMGRSVRYDVVDLDAFIQQAKANN
jgi:excisionase family DNA binding protein